MDSMGSAAESEKLLVRVILNPQDDGAWSAIAPDYTVVGVGDSPEAAVSSVTAMLEDYFAWCAREGMTAEQARRPISLRWRFELAIRLLTRRGLRRTHTRPAPERRDLHLAAPAAC
jgi:hypothetical protein